MVSKFCRVRDPWWMKTCVGSYPSAFDYAMEDQTRVVSNLFLSSTGVFMDEIIVSPSKHVCLGYGGHRMGSKCVSFVSNPTLLASDDLP